uniref:Uncharacterized protein n=1 Tax=Glossina palpalis gambiensis TaxID=67801 RepID=A0A1B0BXM0_9MUSC
MTTDDGFPDIIKIELKINDIEFATTPEEIAIKLNIDGIELSSIPENLDIAILIDTFKKLQEEVEGKQKIKNWMLWKRIPHLPFNNTANHKENNIRVIVNGEERGLVFTAFWGLDFGNFVLGFCFYLVQCGYRVEYVAVREALPCMKPSISLDNTSQTAGESLSTRFDQEYRRYQFVESNTTEEYPTGSSAAALFNSLSRKLNDLFRISDNEAPDNAHKFSGNIAGNGYSSHNQQGPSVEAAIPDLQLAVMLKQQHEMLLSCMQEI